MTDQLPQSFFEKLQKEARMRPRWFFWMRTIGIAVGTALLAGIVVFAIGALDFLWHSRELGALPGFGFRGVPFLVHYFPWHAAALSFIGLVGLLILLRRFTPGYKWPLLFLVALAIAGATIFGAISSRASYHGSLANRSEHGTLPFFGGAYRPRFDDDHLVTGEITEVGEDSCTLNTLGGDVTIHITDDTLLPPFPLSIGQHILVLGTRKGNKVEAKVIRTGPRPFRMPMQAPQDTE